MRDYGHYEEMIRALAALGGSYLRQHHPEQAHACLEEAHELTLTQHFPWQRSEICYRLGLLALAQDQLDEAFTWAQRAQAAVAEGSTSDWLGPINLLLARIAQRRDVSIAQVVFMYQQAISLAEARCRAVERAWVLREAGRHLATQGESDARAHGEAIVRRAEEWLAARGIAG